MLPLSSEKGPGSTIRAVSQLSPPLLEVRIIMRAGPFATITPALRHRAVPQDPLNFKVILLSPPAGNVQEADDYVRYLSGNGRYSAVADHGIPEAQRLKEKSH